MSPVVVRDILDAAVPLAQRARQGEALTQRETHLLRAYLGVVLLFVSASRPISNGRQVIVFTTVLRARPQQAPREGPPRAARRAQAPCGRGCDLWACAACQSRMCRGAARRGGEGGALKGAAAATDNIAWRFRDSIQTAKRGPSVDAWQRLALFLGFTPRGCGILRTIGPVGNDIGPKPKPWASRRCQEGLEATAGEPGRRAGSERLVLSCVGGRVRVVAWPGHCDWSSVFVADNLRLPNARLCHQHDQRGVTPSFAGRCRRASRTRRATLRRSTASARSPRGSSHPT